MISYFADILQRARTVESDVEARVVLMSGLRQLLQVVAYGLVDWIATRGPDPETQPPRSVVDALHAPTDGTLVEAVDALLVAAEQNGWSGIYKIGSTQLPDSSECNKLCVDYPTNVLGLLQSMVAMRNDGGEGHGLPGGYNRKLECEALELLLNAFEPVLPIGNDNSMRIGPHTCEIDIRTIRVHRGRPALIRKIQEVNSATVRVRAQAYTSSGGVDKFTYEATNVFSKFQSGSLASLKSYDNSWSPLYYLPDRVTDTFTGRDAERAALLEWLDDQESRSCLVYGDGGVGKTTLVVEVIHQLLDEEVSTSWKPRVISFYTAKRTQFGIDGLTPVGAGRPHLMDLLVHLHILFFAKYPEKQFYKYSIGEAAQILQTRMKEELGIGKGDHLIIIDNAETLIESTNDREELGRQLKDISRRVGRVLITSRRRELLGAEPVEIKPLSSVDAIHFLRKRGSDKLSIQAIKRATDQQLYGIVEVLERRPIVLQAFLNALCDPATDTLEKAKVRVASMLRRDLGEFLFSDAWTRLHKDVRKLLVLMSRIADVHDAQSFRICSDICNVAVHDAEKALVESNGIASVVYIDGALQVAFSKNFIDFCKDQSGASDAEVQRARQRYGQFLARASKFSGDRVAEAFRTPVARAAHRAKQDGDFEGARDLYAQAVLADSTNGWLFDRYAYFFFHDLRDNDAALHQARRATELLPTEGEVWFTRGLIEARLGDFRAAESSLAKARQLGISDIRCALQLAWAYLKAKPRPQLDLAAQQLHFLDVRTAPLSVNDRSRVETAHIRERFEFLRGRYQR